MLPIGVRASICAKVLTSSNKSFSTSSCLAGKIYKSTRERPIISTYKAKDRTFRVEAAQPEDIPLLTDFMSEIAAEHEPSSISTGTTAAEFRPFVEKYATEGIRYTMIFMDEDRVVAGGIASCMEIDRAKAFEPKIREDYGELIDSLEDWIPSRKMRQVVAPAYDTANMISHFLPKDVMNVMSYDLACVHKSATGGNTIKKMIYEVAMSGLRDGLKYGSTQTTACASHKAHVKTGSKDVFKIPYGKMLDHGKRVHPKVPLSDGSTGVSLFVLDLESLAKVAKC
jgi:hypothetical protein